MTKRKLGRAEPRLDRMRAEHRYDIHVLLPQAAVYSPTYIIILPFAASSLVS